MMIKAALRGILNATHIKDDGARRQRFDQGFVAGAQELGSRVKFAKNGRGADIIGMKNAGMGDQVVNIFPALKDEDFPSGDSGSIPLSLESS